MKKILNYFTKFELFLWSFCTALIVVSFFLFEKESYLTLIASVIGVTAIIFNAKGNFIGPLLMINFSIIYGIISFSFSYYGEMITYVGMSMPMAICSLFSWVKNPYKENKAQVKIRPLKKSDIVLMVILAAAVTVAFYFILKYFNNANLELSTLSVATSFVAAYLNFLRCPYFALAYAFNDIVLIPLWILASIHDTKYISVVVCFIAFLLSDAYSFVNWSKMKKKQEE